MHSSCRSLAAWLGGIAIVAAIALPTAAQAQEQGDGRRTTGTGTTTRSSERTSRGGQAGSQIFQPPPDTNEEDPRLPAGLHLDLDPQTRTTLPSRRPR